MIRVISAIRSANQKLTTNDANYFAITIRDISAIRSANHKVNYELRKLHKLISNNDSCHSCHS